MQFVKAKRTGPPTFMRGRPFYRGDIVDIPHAWILGEEAGWVILAPERFATPQPTPEATTPAAAQEAPAETPDLSWSRAQLEEHAQALGLDASSARNKQAVLDLIRQAG